MLTNHEASLRPQPLPSAAKAAVAPLAAKAAAKAAVAPLAAKAAAKAAVAPLVAAVVPPAPAASNAAADDRPVKSVKPPPVAAKAAAKAAVAPLAAAVAPLVDAVVPPAADVAAADDRPVKSVKQPPVHLQNRAFTTAVASLAANAGPKAAVTAANANAAVAPHAAAAAAAPPIPDAAATAATAPLAANAAAAAAAAPNPAAAIAAATAATAAAASAPNPASRLSFPLPVVLPLTILIQGQQDASQTPASSSSRAPVGTAATPPRARSPPPTQDLGPHPPPSSPPTNASKDTEIKLCTVRLNQFIAMQKKNPSIQLQEDIDRLCVRIAKLHDTSAAASSAAPSTTTPAAAAAKAPAAAAIAAAAPPIAAAAATAATAPAAAATADPMMLQLMDMQRMYAEMQRQHGEATAAMNKQIGILTEMLHREQERAHSRSVSRGTSRGRAPQVRGRSASREPHGRGRWRQNTPGLRLQGSAATAWLQQGSASSSATAEPQGSDWNWWRPGASTGAPQVETMHQWPRACDKPPVRHFSGGKKNVMRGPACPWVDDDDEDTLAQLRPSSPILWDEALDLVRDFRAASKFAMQARWTDMARLMKENPDVCRLRLPDGGAPGAGYGLLQTLCTKATPDWLVDWVLHRTPIGVIGFAYNEICSGVPPLMGFDFPPLAGFGAAPSLYSNVAFLKRPKPSR